MPPCVLIVLGTAILGISMAPNARSSAISRIYVDATEKNSALKFIVYQEFSTRTIGMRLPSSAKVERGRRRGEWGAKGGGERGP